MGPGLVREMSLVQIKGTRRWFVRGKGAVSRTGYLGSNPSSDTCWI